MIREAFDHCDDLLDDPDLSAAEKQEIENYVADAQIKIRNIHKDAADEEERYQMLLEFHSLGIFVSLFVICQVPQMVAFCWKLSFFVLVVFILLYCYCFRWW